MPILTNKNHKAFAQGVAKGLTADQAYQDTGYNENRSKNELKGTPPSAFGESSSAFALP